MQRPPASARGRLTEGELLFLAGFAAPSYRDASQAGNPFRDTLDMRWEVLHGRTP
jgi:hypothetical protein